MFNITIFIMLYLLLSLPILPPTLPPPLPSPHQCVLFYRIYLRFKLTPQYTTRKDKTRVKPSLLSHFTLYWYCIVYTQQHHAIHQAWSILELNHPPIWGLCINTKNSFRIKCLILFYLVFAFGRSYSVLFIARALQGIGSSCSSVSGRDGHLSHYLR